MLLDSMLIYMSLRQTLQDICIKEGKERVRHTHSSQASPNPQHCQATPLPPAILLHRPATRHPRPAIPLPPATPLPPAIPSHPQPMG